MLNVFDLMAGDSGLSQKLDNFNKEQAEPESGSIADNLIKECLSELHKARAARLARKERAETAVNRYFRIE